MNRRISKSKTKHTIVRRKRCESIHFINNSEIYRRTMPAGQFNSNKSDWSIITTASTTESNQRLIKKQTKHAMVRKKVWIHPFHHSSSNSSTYTRTRGMARLNHSIVLIYHGKHWISLSRMMMIDDHCQKSKRMNDAFFSDERLSRHFFMSVVVSEKKGNGNVVLCGVVWNMYYQSDNVVF